MKAPRIPYGTRICSSFSQSCKNYSTWSVCCSEKCGFCQHKHFPLPKGHRFKTKKNAIWISDVTLQTKRGAEVLHGKVVTSSAWQCHYKPCCAGLYEDYWVSNAAECYRGPCKTGLKFTLIKGGVLGTMSSFSLEVITRDAILMKIILLFQASANNWVSNPEQYITLPSYPKSSPSFLLPFSHPTNLIQALLLQNVILQCLLELELEERKHFKVPCKGDQMISSQDHERFQGLLRKLSMN